MPIIGSILTRVFELRKTLPSVNVKRNAYKMQKNTFAKLLNKASYTAFGQHYGFNQILNSSNPMREFQKKVPVFDYNEIYKQWWSRTMNEENNICWPGKIKYFALSSGTSESASKHIPITSAMLKSIKRTSVRQLLTLAKYDVPDDILKKGFLMIGGSTDLNQYGSYYEGDLSGITTGNIPVWFQSFYKPGKLIAQEKDWNIKLEKIVALARDWDIGIILGVPAWIQIIMERIIDRYKLKNIHEIWPNLSIFVHGGVSFEPYKKGFEKLLAKPLTYIETYLASEGFIAYQNTPQTNSMKLALNTGIFFEFVPFNLENFDASGNIKKKPTTLLIDEVQEGKEYALLLSTNAGAWRYLIGDTIKFTSKANYEIIITGRTKQFLSLCGEHLSVENMNQAITSVSQQLNVAVSEYMVAGINIEGQFGHHWFLGVDKMVDETQLINLIDKKLIEINDDYATERKHALKHLIVTLLPIDVFSRWMESKGKSGGQNKFPRVMKGALLEEWNQFIAKQNTILK